MASTDAAFLTEVESFLNLLELPPLPVPSDSNNEPVSLKPKDDVSLVTFEGPESPQKVDSVGTTRRVKERTRRKSYRERQLIEREKMVHEIKRLTEEIQRARGQQLYERAWKALAQRQLTARLKVEAEQKQLCQAVFAHGEMMQKVQNFLRTYDCPLMTDFAPQDVIGAACFQQTRIRLMFVNAEIFATFVRELDEAYAKTDLVLTSWGMDSTEANWDAPSEISDSESAFQFKSKITMPFSFKEICHSRWMVSRFYHRQEGREMHDKAAELDNTLAVKFRVKTRLNSGKLATAVQRLVIRRYLETERMVIVWRLFTEGEGVFTGMSSDEAGWCVATPARTARKGTVIRTCVNNKAMLCSDKAGTGPVVNKFKSQLLEWGLENNEEVTNGLKKVLIR
uniref:BZIP domain-containing protein n=1 Tax=Peronospora matthiolae TaxID=2874970 RepID=A0AAV1UQV3_9STRA